MRRSRNFRRRLRWAEFLRPAVLQWEAADLPRSRVVHRLAQAVADQRRCSAPAPLHAATSGRSEASVAGARSRIRSAQRRPDSVAPMAMVAMSVRSHAIAQPMSLEPTRLELMPATGTA